MEIAARDRVRGCLLGGAVGDALGAAVEFDAWPAIVAAHGPAGVRGPLPAYGHPCPITDDTQMTLFTAEGLLRAAAAGADDPIPAIHRAYLRWLHTQGLSSRHPDFDDALDGWLVRQPGLHAARAPGNTCIAGLTQPRLGTPEAPLNDSKGCGGVMRIAPIGLWLDAPGELAGRACALTHGHPSGYGAGVALAELLAGLVRGLDPTTAARRAAEDPRVAGEVADAIAAAIALAEHGPATVAGVQSLGEGWVAEEALAIGLYCALATEGFAQAVCAAVNHGGDSDSTGSIAGQIVGAWRGQTVIPTAWLDVLELRAVVETIADDLAAAIAGAGVPRSRYPGQ